MRWIVLFLLCVLSSVVCAAPLVNVTAAPSGGAITIQASATDSDGPGLASMSVTVDGVTIWSDSFSVPHMAEGMGAIQQITAGFHTVMIKATNKAGEMSMKAIQVGQ